MADNHAVHTELGLRGYLKYIVVSPCPMTAGDYEVLGLQVASLQ